MSSAFSAPSDALNPSGGGRADPSPALGARVSALLYWSCALLLTIPVLAPRYFPTEDGLAHLYWVEIYRRLADPAGAAAQIFSRNISWAAPHQLLYFGLQYGLGSLIDPHVAQQLIVAFTILTWAGAIWFLSRSVAREITAGAFAALLLIHSSWLYNGFFAFIGALPLVLIELGLLARLADGREGADRPTTYLALALLGVLTHFAHFFVGALYLLLGGWWLAFHWRRPPFRRAWLGASLAPLGGLIILYFAQGTLGTGGPKWEPLTRAAARFFGLAFFRGYAAPTPAYFVALAAFAALIVWLCWSSIRMQRWSEMPPSRRAVVALAAVLGAIYFVSPQAMGEAYPLNGRLQYATLAWLLPCLPFPAASRSRTLGLVAVVLLLGWQVLDYGGRALRASRHYERIVRQGEVIDRGAVITSSVVYDSARFEGSFVRVLASVPEDIAERRHGLLVNNYFTATPFYWVRQRHSADARYVLDLRTTADRGVDLLVRPPR